LILKLKKKRKPLQYAFKISTKVGRGSSRYGEIELGGYTDEIEEVVGEEGIEEAPIYDSMITGSSHQEDGGLDHKLYVLMGEKIAYFFIIKNVLEADLYNKAYENIQNDLLISYKIYEICLDIKHYFTELKDEKEKNKHKGIYNKEDVKKMIKDLEEHVEKGGSKEKDYVSPFMIEEPEASSSALKPLGREKARSLSVRERAKTIADMPIFERSATTTVNRKKGETIHLGKQ
uniref:Uncharacterized protein n=1 Tax=Meloidogyne javanica TaxID=6303 RepID=A0A915MHV9_MELJA